MRPLALTAPDTYPHYGYPPLLVAAFLRDALLGRRRSFRQDACSCIHRLRPPLRLIGQENIPQHGPCVLTFNHYARPGFRAWWLAWAVAASVPMEMHWIVTREWTFPGRWYAPLGLRLSRLILRRLASLYSFTLMPAMPPRPEDVTDRARAVRQVLALARREQRIVLGLAPEGRDTPGGCLSWPPPGVGRFLTLLAEAGLHIVPVGLYEAEGALWAHFGERYALSIPADLSPDERDRLAAQTVMSRIAALLPPALRGDFA